MGIVDAIFRGRKPSVKPETEEDSGIQTIIRELTHQDRNATAERDDARVYAGRRAWDVATPAAAPLARPVEPAVARAPQPLSEPERDDPAPTDAELVSDGADMPVLDADEAAFLARAEEADRLAAESVVRIEESVEESPAVASLAAYETVHATPAHALVEDEPETPQETMTEGAAMTHDPVESMHQDSSKPTENVHVSGEYDDPYPGPSPEHGADASEDETMNHGDERYPEGADAYSSPAQYDASDDLPMPIGGSPRQAQFEAFKAITNEMEDKLRQFSDAVALSRLTISSMQPFLAHFESDIQIADEVERERNALSVDMGDMKRSLELTQRDLAMRITTLNAANERNNELRIELDQRRMANQELSLKLERIRKEQERAASEIATARADIIRLSAALERESAEKDSLFQSRIEISNKYAKLQQTEAQTRNKHLELTVQHDKLTKSQPHLVAEQEKLRNELRVAQREKTELHNRLLTAQDQIAQLESEIQSQQGFLASEAFASRTELEMHQSALRTAEKAIAEADSRNKELQRQLRDVEVSRNSAESQAAMLQQELDDVRRERADAAFKLSDVNLKYMTDLLSLDQQREQNKEFQYDIDALLAEKRRMAKFESMYKAAEAQIVSLKEKLSLLAENLKDSTDPEKLRRSIEIIGELSVPQIAANTDKPMRPATATNPGAKKALSSH